MSGTVTLADAGSAKPPLPPVKSAADGSFSFSAIPAGVYRICATPAGSGYVDSCLWRGGGFVQIKAGNTVSGRRIVVEAAGILQVQVNDPGSVLSNTPAAGAVGSHLMVGVVTDRKIFLSMPIASNSKAGRTHAIAVPVDRNVSVRLMTHGVTVAGSGAPNKDLSGTDVPVKVNSGPGNGPLVLTVKGGGN